MWFPSSRNSGFSWEWRRIVQTLVTKHEQQSVYWKVHCVCVLFSNTPLWVFFFNLSIFGHSWAPICWQVSFTAVFFSRVGCPSFRARTSHRVAFHVEPDSRADAQQLRLWAQSLCTMWDLLDQNNPRLPRGLAGGFFPTEPPGTTLCVEPRGQFLSEPGVREKKDNGRPWWIFSREVA